MTGVFDDLCGSANQIFNATSTEICFENPVGVIKITDGQIEAGEIIGKFYRQLRVAREFLASVAQPIIAIHPGSGSHEKNWPLENWIGLFSPDSRLAKLGSLVVISGEAEDAQTSQLEREWKNRDLRFARNLPLPRLAAVLERSIFIGHDSGISHLAAAVGANCILLFGPTDPDVWAPKNENVRVLRPPSGKLKDLQIETVEAALAAAL